eukprot:scaffold3899_cov80-Skeletonema_marinoi.AAC.1
MRRSWTTRQRNPKPEGNVHELTPTAFFIRETVGKIMDRRQKRMDSYVWLGLTPKSNTCIAEAFRTRRLFFFTEGGCQGLSRRHTEQNTVEEVCGCTKCEERSARRLENVLQCRCSCVPSETASSCIGMSSSSASTRTEGPVRDRL